MTPEQERWAEALAVLRMHGTGAEAFIGERIATLARWQAVATRLRQVREAEYRPLSQT